MNSQIDGFQLSNNYFLAWIKFSASYFDSNNTTKVWNEAAQEVDH